MWTLESAIVFLRDLEEVIAPDWHCSLAGGVLQRGQSNHDLDVILIPHSTNKYFETCGKRFWDLRKIRDAMTSFGYNLYKDANEMRAHWRTKGSEDSKHVEVWLDQYKRRVDLIIWPPEQVPQQR